MIDPTQLLPALIESSRAALSLTRGAFAAAADHDVKDKLIGVQSAILDIQEKLGDAHAARLALLDELAELKGKVRELEGAKDALDKYELFEINPGNYVRRPKVLAGSEPMHYACPTCYSEGRIGPMQRGADSWGPIWKCSICRFSLRAGERSTSPPPSPDTGTSWMAN